MEMRKFLIAILVLGLVASFVATKVVGQEITDAPPIIELTAVSTNFTYTASCLMTGAGDNGVQYKALVFYPSTGDTGDVLVVRNGSTSGPKICILRTIDYTDSRYVDLGGARLKPFIVWSECSMSTGHTITFILSKP